MRTRPPRAYTFPLVLLVVVVLDWYYIGTAQFVNALTIGGVYALIALGYTMVYGIIELINFAHGDVFMVGSMVTMFLLTQLGLSGAVNNPIELAVLLVVTFLWAMTIMGIIGVIIERFAYRPLRNAPKLAPLITAIGVSFILENIAQILVGPSPVSVPQIIDTQAQVSLLGTEVSVLKLFVVVIAVALMVVLQLFITRTRMGRAMRSTAMDRDAAELMGVDIKRVSTFAYAIYTGLTAMAGVLIGSIYSITAQDGPEYTLLAFFVVVLAGLGSVGGVLIVSRVLQASWRVWEDLGGAA